MPTAPSSANRFAPPPLSSFLQELVPPFPQLAPVKVFIFLPPSFCHFSLPPSRSLCSLAASNPCPSVPEFLPRYTNRRRLEVIRESTDGNFHFDSGAGVLCALNLQAAANMGEPFFHVIEAITTVIRPIHDEPAAVIGHNDSEVIALHR